MKTCLAALIVILGFNAFANELTLQEKAIEGAKSLYQLNSGSLANIENITTGNFYCSTDQDLSYECYMTVVIQEANRKSSNKIFKATFQNKTLKKIEQDCVVCR